MTPEEVEDHACSLENFVKRVMKTLVSELGHDAQVAADVFEKHAKSTYGVDVTRFVPEDALTYMDMYHDSFWDVALQVHFLLTLREVWDREEFIEWRTKLNESERSRYYGPIIL